MIEFRIRCAAPPSAASSAAERSERSGEVVDAAGVALE